MSKEPWLAELPDEDWVSQPPSPCPLPHSPSLPSSPSQQSARKCFSCSHRSRIPKPPEPASPHARGKSTPRGGRQGQTRRGGSTTPSSARASSSPRQSSSTRSPRVQNNAQPKPSPKTRPKPMTPGRKKPTSTPLKNVVSTRPSTMDSMRTDGQGTIQVRPTQEVSKETPEWKKRLVRGEVPSDEQCDLFAPLGLENIFKDPTTDGEPEGQSPSMIFGSQRNRTEINKRPNTQQKKAPNQPESSSIRVQERGREMGTVFSKHFKLGPDGVSEADDRLRTASGEEDLRNEGITPIFLSNNNTADRQTGSDVLQSALKQLNDLAGSRKTSRIGSLKEQKGNNEAYAAQFGDLLNVSSPYFPEDLSTGTQEAVSTQPFVNIRRGGYSEDGSFRVRQLSPSSFPSQLQSSIIENSEFRSSPPVHNAAVTSLDGAQIPEVTFSPTGSPPGERPLTANMNSPLKLFGNHDTFTNNKLLRRMSQFEETFGDVSSDEDEPVVSPTLGTRRTRANRSLPNLRRGQLDGQSPRKLTRPVTQDAADPRMNRFGNGQLDDFGFASESTNKGGIPNISFKSRHPRGNQLGRRSHSRVLGKDNLRKAKSFDSISERRRSSSFGHQATWRTRQGGMDSKQMTRSPAKGSTPKRRRTKAKTQGQNEADKIIESLLEMKLDDKGLKPNPYRDTSSSFAFKQPQTNWDSMPLNPPYNDDDSKEDVLTLDDHKRSLTTDDYISQATQVMDMIRAKGKYKSGLTSVEESDITGESDEDGTLTEISSPENLSRPPSRDGVDMRKLREPCQLNPRVVSHLKKFADKEDTEQLMASVVSHLDQEPRLASSGQFDDDSFDDIIESSFQNARILPQRKRKLSDDDQPENSIPTNSSTGSNARGNIASGMVSHLIPEQVNGMTYDHSTKSWVKQKIGTAMTRARADESEDDPFASIPDLSVDEVEEIKRSQQQYFHTTKNEHPTDQPTKANIDASKISLAAQRPITRDGPTFIPDSSSVQSKNTRFTSSGPQPETRATSWGTEDLTVNAFQNSSPVSKDTTLHEGRTIAHPRRSKVSGQTRAATISFSSPLVSHIVYTDDVNEGQAEENSHKYHNDSIIGPSGGISVDSRPFIRRPVSRIDEQNEESIGEMSLVRRDSSTPQTHQIANSTIYPPSAGSGNYSFHLSPLADFTVNQPDDPVNLELSYIAQRTKPSSLREVHGTLALAAEDLVKHITDVEPTEPFWEDLRRLNLRNKGLMTLHRLNEFCPHLEELDVSENELGHLSGAPFTLRSLRVQQNYLTNLTAWGHLVNLQYLDISGNQLQSLDGFSGLVHLRELRANNNRIRTIDGILDLNGLLRLELKNNALISVDFGGSELSRLGEIDLSNNQISVVRNLEYLPALETLNISANEIKQLQPIVPLQALQRLRASSNRFYSFDASLFPHLKLLYLDANCLSTVSGLSKCNNLEVLSVREQFSGQPQKSESPFDIDISPLADIRKLFLSSNRLSERTLAPSTPMLGLQLLDIASCGLQDIPPRFGKRFPNLRVLNLNFNSVKELGEIAGMNGLSRLTAVGNRISRLRMICQVISKVGQPAQYGGNTLKNIDLRGNPLTVGFYPPAISGSGRADTHIKLLQIRRKEAAVSRKRIESEIGPLTTIGGGSDMEVLDTKDNGNGSDMHTNVEIDDPYTLPPADAEADQKYRSRLDESTKVRRMTMELLMYAGTRGSIKVLDGLDLRPILEGEKREIDRIWGKLEALGVFKRN
ncbi:hypothetical protein BGW36DRAFT_408249 [Talaromyces proteolyticus]|uniref:Uncharacterized protein n=1 Tax=Talaromyces proteolyticus TaxID=1131652 RepID=A0AAD4KPK0_9EURO|nr:uncharacterized protein BGW36DRAFT_408249 [Talaromyces proteolyticus]KAH8696346.1 hypothetical protein BGW36DRAFT_408249 [Talaromyces proteolyticus]